MKAYEPKFFRIGGVAQLNLCDSDDLIHLCNGDLKLWTALALPLTGVYGDTQTFQFLDTDGDHRLRPPELQAALRWCDETWHNLEVFFRKEAILSTEELKSESLKASLMFMMCELGQENTKGLTLEQVQAFLVEFVKKPLNGDGIILPSVCPHITERELVEAIIKSYGSKVDRSGEAGVDAELITTFFADLTAQLRWHENALDSATIAPFGIEKTKETYRIYQNVRKKIDDFFARCQLFAFDSRAKICLETSEADYKQLSAEDLTLQSSQMAMLPLATLNESCVLPLTKGCNPAWQNLIESFRHGVVQSCFGEALDELSMAKWNAIHRLMAPYEDWLNRRPATKLQDFSLEKMRLWESISAVPLLHFVEKDLALKPHFDAAKDLSKAMLFKRDLVTILQNFVNFAAFYGKENALFQSGTFYFSGRAALLCVDVTDPTKHALVASYSNAMLVYCECSRKGETVRHIVAVITRGDADPFVVGRRGVFYDRKGCDWDAYITKVIVHPISLQEAFWMPYKKTLRFIQEQIAKRAAAAELATTSTTMQLSETVANTDKAETVQNMAKESAKKIDVGTVAAIGVALGSIGAFLGVIFGKFLDLGLFMPVGILVLILLISGPSVILAYIKLRQRDLGPILDASGWAVNTSIRLNIPFASSLTKLRKIPVKNIIAGKDPFEEKKSPLKYYVLTAIGLLLAGSIWWLKFRS